jgi:predicted DsbA family dithiol-disulfide isomerase
LEEALKQWNGEEVSISYKPFFLNPNTPKEGFTFTEYMHAKGAENVSFDEFVKPIQQMGEACGLPFNFDSDKKIPNTFLSHQLIALTPDDRKESIIDKLYSVYFVEGKDIGRLDTLLEIAKNLDLDPESIRSRIGSTELQNEIISDVNFAVSIGIRGVPFFIIDDKIGVYGAQPPETLIQAMQKALEERGNSSE